MRKIELVTKVVIIGLMLAVASSFLLHKINLPSSDLGRHIKNGQIVFSNPDVLSKNFYSYTEPEFPFVNHHWLSGVLFAVLLPLVGWSGLVFFKALIVLTTFLLAWWIARRNSSFFVASLLAVPAILLLSERTEVRPEMFSCFLFVVYWLVLDVYEKKGWHKFFWLWPLVHILWTNLHIYSFLGLAVLGWYNFLEIIKHRISFFKNKDRKNFFVMSCLVFLSGLANPNFVKGLLYPLRIFENYGYEIVENKTPWFIENLMLNYNFFIFKLLIALLVISFVVVFIRLRKLNWFNFGLAVLAVTIGSMAIRNLTLAGFISLPVLAENFGAGIRKDFGTKLRWFGWLLLLLIYSGLAWSVFSGNYYNKQSSSSELGWGLVEKVERSVEFFQEQNLSGPIFNNYDVGSFLTYYLCPQEKVFVDNRPEAFSVEFFEEIYKPMQLDDEKWTRYSAEYNFNVIFFSHTDGTYWARSFLKSRLKDEGWVLVFVDPYNLILVKNKPENKEVIANFEISDTEIEGYLENLEAEYLDSKSKNNIASLYSLFGFPHRAQSIYESFLNKNPNGLRDKVSLAYTYMNQDEIAKAATLLEEAVASGWRLPSAYNNLGLIYFYSQDITRAKKMWEEALWLDKNNSTASGYLEQIKGLSR